jgi:hypothetical protein
MRLGAVVSLALAAGACALPGSADSAHGRSALATCATRASELSIGSVRQDGELDQKWASYIASDKGWTGGDSVYAYVLPGGRRLFSFSDSFIGNLLPGDRRPAYNFIYHNLFVVSGPRGFQLITGGTAKDRQAIVSATPIAKGYHFYLLLGGIVERTTFQAVFMERLRTGPFSLDNVPVASVIGTFSLPSLRLLRLSPVRAPPAPVQWGSYVARFGAWTYIYGASSNGLDKSAYVARVPGADLTGAWTYWDGHGWSRSWAKAALLVRHVDQEYSVTRFDGIYVLLSSDSEQPFSPSADMYFACSPTGPFRHERSFVVSYFVGPIGAKLWGDGAVYVYDALVQPALSKGGDLVVSYDQNSLNFAAILDHADIYRPGYLVVRLVHGPAH